MNGTDYKDKMDELDKSIGRKATIEEGSEFFKQKHQEAVDDVKNQVNNQETSASVPKINPSDFRSIEDYANQGWKNEYSGGPQEALAGRLKNFMKKGGPVGSIAAIILGVGGGLGFFGQTLMPISVIQQFTNDQNDLNASQQRKTLDSFGAKLGGDSKKKADACAKPKSARCKGLTLHVDTAKRFEDKGYKFGNPVKVGDRIAFTSMTFPDNTTFNNPAEFKNFMKNSFDAQKMFDRAHNLRNSPYVVSDWFSKNVLGALGLSKAPKIKGDTKEEADKSFEDSTKNKKQPLSLSSRGGGGDDEEGKKQNSDSDEYTRSVNQAIAGGQRIQSLPVSKFTKGLAGIGRFLCSIYNTSRFIVVISKTKKILAYAAFGMILLTGISKHMAGKDTEAEFNKVMSIMAPNEYPAEVEDPVTGKMIPNPDIGKNITDSEPYQVIALGADIDLSNLATRFLVASGALGIIEKVLTWMNDNLGKQNIKTTCKVLNNPLAGIVSILAAPVFTLVSEVVLQLFPVDEYAAALVNIAIDVIAGTDFTTGIIGADAGRVLFIAVAAILGKSSNKFGLRPANASQIKKNVNANHEILERETAIAKEDAAKTPFDITNRYSFLGALAGQVAQFTPTSMVSFTASFSKILSAFPGSLNLLAHNAGAAWNMPVSYSDSRFNKCNDEDYKALGIAPDMFCTVRYAPFEPVPLEEVLDYMESTGQINDEGEPVAGKHLDFYTRFCTNREDPWGTTTVAAEEQTESGDWYTGKNCLPDTKDNQMSSEYTGYRTIQQVIDREASAAASSKTTNVNGDAKSLAAKVANNPNIILSDASKTALLQFSRGEPVMNACNTPATVSKHLLGALLTNASKYKIVITNFGFAADRGFCDSGQHPKGTAVDIGRIDVINGGTTGTIQLPNGLTIVNQYATDFLAALPPYRGGVGQKQYGVNPTFPPNSIALNGTHLFNDDAGNGNHLHIDARNRQNLNDLE